MQSNFGHARELLEQAWLQLSGDDNTSQKSRMAIDILSKPWRRPNTRSRTDRPK
jgi:hypothetical protein